MKENLESVKFNFDIDNKVIRHLDNPIKQEGTLKILKGTLAPGSAVLNCSRHKARNFLVGQGSLTRKRMPLKLSQSAG